MDDESKLSVNNMVEMAMGLSMASLFSQAMNSAFSNSTRILKDDPMYAPARYIHAIVNGEQKGPFSSGEIMSMIQSGTIVPETYMWKPGMPEWKPAKDITDITPGLELIPPAAPQNESR